MVLIEVKTTPEKTPDNIHLRNIKRNQKRGNAGVEFNGFQSGIIRENRGGFYHFYFFDRFLLTIVQLSSYILAIKRKIKGENP